VPLGVFKANIPPRSNSFSTYPPPAVFGEFGPVLLASGAIAAALSAIAWVKMRYGEHREGGVDGMGWGKVETLPLCCLSCPARRVAL